jgi:transposase
VIFVGDDWAEAHHDIQVHDEHGRCVASRRLPEGLEGLARLHALLADWAGDPAEVVVGIETDRGLWVGALAAAGYQVYAINPKAVHRYRERHVLSGAKSDSGDAKVLADLVRTDRHNHRPIAGDSARAEAVKVLARAHQRLVWARQRQLNVLRSTLREFYPAALLAFGTDLANRDALAVLAIAPTPARGRALSHAELAETLHRAGRQRGVQARARALRAALRSPQPEPSDVLASAFGAAVTAGAAVVAELNRQLVILAEQLAKAFATHPDAQIIRSQPGLGAVLGARLLGEFGDDPDRYRDANSRRRYAGTAPITKASGTKKVVLARFVRNRHLADACYLWAFCALTHSPGARAFYDAHRARGNTHDQAVRVLANKLVGILDGCLRSRSLYNEATAWKHQATKEAA